MGFNLISAVIYGPRLKRDPIIADRDRENRLKFADDDRRPHFRRAFLSRKAANSRRR